MNKVTDFFPSLKGFERPYPKRIDKDDQRIENGLNLYHHEYLQQFPKSWFNTFSNFNIKHLSAPARLFYYELFPYLSVTFPYGYIAHFDVPKFRASTDVVHLKIKELSYIYQEGESKMALLLMPVSEQIKLAVPEEGDFLPRFIPMAHDQELAKEVIAELLEEEFLKKSSNGLLYMPKMSNRFQDYQQKLWNNKPFINKYKLPLLF